MNGKLYAAAQKRTRDPQPQPTPTPTRRSMRTTKKQDAQGDYWDVNVQGGAPKTPIPMKNPPMPKRPPAYDYGQDMDWAQVMDPKRQQWTPEQEAEEDTRFHGNIDRAMRSVFQGGQMQRIQELKEMGFGPGTDSEVEDPVQYWWWLLKRDEEGNLPYDDPASIYDEEEGMYSDDEDEDL